MPVNPISEQAISGFTQRLENHPVYAALASVQDLRCFMQHHVFPVWDFMSLIKYLQARVAPAHQPWLPPADANIARFINELVLEEESDQAPPGAGDDLAFTSHFQLYCGAMREVGADPGPVLAFLDQVREQGLDPALAQAEIPEPARRFTRTSFAFIAADRPHEVAAALALGREHIIPGMFRGLLKRLGVSPAQAPAFHYYLNRHLHLDADFHAPLSLRLLNQLCNDDPRKQAEALAAAETAVLARLTFWDGVLEALETKG